MYNSGWRERQWARTAQTFSPISITLTSCVLWHCTPAVCFFVSMPGLHLSSTHAVLGDKTVPSGVSSHQYMHVYNCFHTPQHVYFPHTSTCIFFPPHLCMYKLFANTCTCIYCHVHTSAVIPTAPATVLWELYGMGCVMPCYDNCNNDCIYNGHRSQLR